jgi:branched-chain amino acid transport system permease protein
VLHLLVTRTDFGLGVRATAQNPVMAEIVGIDISRVYLIVSIVSMICLSMAGPLLLMTFSMYPDSGGYYITLGFLITLIGQPGSLLGTLIGGMTVAAAETIVAWYWGAWANGFTIYILFIVVLLIRPLKMRLGY